MFQVLIAIVDDDEPVRDATKANLWLAILFGLIGAAGATISKWARALRYVARCKVASAQLKTFMKEAGGVNAFADMYAKDLRNSRR